jgi:ectoine hydroxylase-related dioxygenase (phytanoyl-CoA dioxygenase family)
MPALTSERATTYHASGYLHLPGLISREEIAVIGTAIDGLPAKAAHLFHPKNCRFEFAHGKVWKFDPVVDLCPEIAALARDPRIMDVLREVFDGRDGSLFKDKLILKPAGTRGNGLHQDYTYWQGFPTNLVTVTISIDAGTRENGCTEIYPGMHTNGLYSEPGKLGDMPEDPVAGLEPQYFESQPGDVALFHCLTPHRAGENRSSAPRRQLFLTYNDSRDGDLYAAHYRHFVGYRSVYEGSDAYLR